MTLTFNPKTGAFVLTSNDEARARAVGLTLSTRVRGANGERVWFTSDKNHQPAFNAYAALPFWDVADDEARAQMTSLRSDYDTSWADSCDRDFPVPSRVNPKTGESYAYMPYQRAGIDYALRRRNCLIGDEPGLGKQEIATNPVLTPDGWTPIGDLIVGDRIATANGSFTRVTGVFPQGIKRIYEVHFRDGCVLECGDEHMWAVSSPLRRKRHRLLNRPEWVVKTTKALMAGGLTGTRGIKNAGRINAKWYIPLVEPIQHIVKELPLDPYVLGVLIGDGALTLPTGVAWSNPDCDDDMRTRVSERLPAGVEQRQTQSSDLDVCPRFNLVPSRPVIDMLTSLRLRNVKSPHRFIPDDYKFASIGQREDLLAGLMDTDGSCIKNRTTFHTMSERLAEDVAEIVRSLGGLAVVRKYDRSAEDKGLEYQVNVKTMFCPFRTTRKSSAWSRPRYSPSRYIHDIVATDRFVDQVCISVEHPSCLYVTKDHVVTHNTITAVGLANALEAQRILVICPASIRLSWQREIRDWSTIRRVSTYPILKSSDGVNPYANFTVVSYNLASQEAIYEALHDIEWDLMILDEAHYLKTIEARRTRAIFGGGRGSFKNTHLTERAKRVVALTGTPLPNRPRECLDGSVRVLTNRGWIPIVKVELTDVLWDGIEWVKHDGLLYQGCAKTVSVAGILATATHRFLAKNLWVSAVEAVQSTDIVSQMLVSGSINLPWSVSNAGSVARPHESRYSVTVEVNHSKQQCSVYALGAHTVADRAERWMVAIRRWLNTFMSVLTIRIVAGYSLSWVTPHSDATTLITHTTDHMAAEASRYINLGAQTGWRFWPTLSPWRIGTNQTGSLIESIMTGVTNPGIFAGRLVNKTCRTEDRYTRCKRKSTILRPVYDIANAGPRRRFTVLSDRGPIITHNCYTLARALCWESIDWASYEQFSYRFNPSAMMDSGAVVEKKGRLPELQSRLRANFMVRRLKKDVLRDLPDKRYEFTYVEADGAIRRVLAKERLIDFDPSMLLGPNFKIDGALATVRREMGEAMVPRVVEHVRYLLDIVELPKIVMFAHHRNVIAALSEILGRYGVVVRIGGQGTVRQQRVIDDFIERDELRIILCQLDTMEGADGLQDVADHAVFAEPAWTPGRNEQCVDRLHRYGQHGNVIAQFMIAEDSFNEKVLKGVLVKAQNIHEALDDREILT